MVTDVDINNRLDEYISDKNSKHTNYLRLRNVEYNASFYIKISLPLKERAILEDNFDYFLNMFLLIIDHSVAYYLYLIDEKKSEYIKNILVNKIYKDLIEDLYKKLKKVGRVGHNFARRDANQTDYLLDNIVCKNFAFYQANLVDKNKKLSNSALIDLGGNFLLNLLNTLIDIRYSAPKNLVDFSLKKYTLHTEMEKKISTEAKSDLFIKYYDIGILLNLSDKQAKYFSCKALDFDRDTICEITETKYRSLEGVKRDIGKKLGFSKERSDFKDRKIKELAEELAYPETLEALNKFNGNDIQAKIDVARKYREDIRLANAVRQNPQVWELLKAQQNQGK